MRHESSLRQAVAASLLAVAAGAPAHHSYVLFDSDRTVDVTGTVAKLEWRNPHVYVWVYVKDPAGPDGHTLYAFENGSTNVLASRGWTKASLVPGESLTVTYWPLRDGRPGGHYVSARRANGEVLRGAGGPRGIDGDLPSLETGAAKRPAAP